ncbi:hypothetical protein GUJ93_ZPchr0014g46851 [Zizania palustris]|uniref:Uncharacterized protein n=1 Tax=Zizania palustris TaxID=103762 RepID=A0A8J5TKX9_ZIZPA|nr:hypothetical protein GUJ93_ZPchr0014g46851 [Zizania palustris]
MPEPGTYGYKKTDGICNGVCGEPASKAVLTMSRLKCVLRGFDFRALLALLIGVPILILMIYAHGQKVTYFLRPIWESPPEPFKIIPHYYHENVTMENLCKLHGWKVRETPRRVFDAVLFSNELDILEIRWNELSPYVSEFVLLESNSTFTGLEKALHFKDNRVRFGFAESRLTYGMIGGRFVKGENPFVEESYQRVALDQLIKIAKIENDDLLIMSDVDEIPSGHTINLLRWCDDIPEILHLQLRNYLYSFQFFLDDKSWRASIHRYRSGKTRGADLFDMLPEEYTFQEIIAKLGPIPTVAPLPPPRRSHRAAAVAPPPPPCRSRPRSAAVAPPSLPSRPRRPRAASVAPAAAYPAAPVLSPPSAAAYPTAPVLPPPSVALAAAYPTAPRAASTAMPPPPPIPVHLERPAAPTNACNWITETEKKQREGHRRNT